MDSDKERIIIFGTGSISKFLTEHIRKNVEIIAYMTTDGTDKIEGKKVIALKQLGTLEYDYVVVAFGNTPKGIEVLKNAGVPETKIVGYAYSGVNYDNNLLQKQCDIQIENLVRSKKTVDLFDLSAKKYYVCGMNIPEEQDIITRDFVREQTIALLAKEIRANHVSGNVAEIGVSEGILAAKINALFPDRTLYLFDTYSGLPEQDRIRAEQQGWGEKLYALSEHGTPEEEVLNIMPHKEKCVIKKGYFPDSFDVKEKLAFVSLDLDFYETTKKGLEKVYPQLSEGGYIMVHDYNNLAFTETHNAVTEFCRENHVVCVPVPDVAGTAVLVKHG